MSTPSDVSAAARSKQIRDQYSYNAVSNLVLQNRKRRGVDEQHEVKSLVQFKNVNDMIHEMGSRAKTIKQIDSKAKLNHPKTTKGTFSIAPTVNPNPIDLLYQPITHDNKLIYDNIVTIVNELLREYDNDVPHDVLLSYTDDILSILKNDSITINEQQVAVQSILYHNNKNQKLDNEKFRTLVNTAKKISDYSISDHTDESKDSSIDQDGVEVSVVFDDDDDNGNELKEQDSDNELVNDGTMYDVDKNDDLSDTDNTMFTTELIDDGNETIDIQRNNNYDKKQVDLYIDARDVDAHWIQRQLKQLCTDPIQAQQLSVTVYDILSSGQTNDIIENKLVTLLGFERFNLIKLLLHNRIKLVYCIKLARTADDNERQQIEADMQQSDQLRSILDDLRSTSTEPIAHNNNSTSMDIDKDSASKPQYKDSEITTHWKLTSKQLLDFSTISSTTTHSITTNQVKLPKNSEIIQHKGYQEVHVPPYVQQPYDINEKLIDISSLPQYTHNAFSGMTHLNRIQSRVCNIALNTYENMLVCAPTGAGKTNVAMLCMLQQIGLYIGSDGHVDKSAFKIVYVAPMKALVQEVVGNFSKRLSSYDITVRELSGDVQLSREEIDSTQIIVTTPEKWDIITRKSSDNTYLSLIKLIIIDEIHLLHDSRGPVLEAIVARTIRQIEQTSDLVRIVGISATLPNYIDVALFLRVDTEKGLFYFDSSYRPVPLQQQYIGLTQKKPHKRIELMNDIVYEKCIDMIQNKHQVLVFTHSRKDTAATAKLLRDKAIELNTIQLLVQSNTGRELLLKTESESCKSSVLKELLPYGIAIHHAGLHRTDRTLVEELFADNHISVLISTATLAWGVNLPAHAVIIKGTQVYSPEKGEYIELSPLDVIQMLGRAGRPQFDTRGDGIIITTQKEMYYYLSLLNSQLPVESQLISKLADYLCAEIVLGSITSVQDSIQWIGYTYLYIRMLRSPELYGIDVNSLDNDQYLQQYRINLIHTAATLLDKYKLIVYNRNTGSLHHTELGRISSHYYIAYTSMAIYTEHLTSYTTDIDLLHIFTLSTEFQQMSVRAEEKVELNKLLDLVPIPVQNSNINNGITKCNVLLQTYISKLQLNGFALYSDMVYITQSALRLLRGMYEICISLKLGATAVLCLNLCKSVQHQQWIIQTPLRQFPLQINRDIIRKIENRGVSIDDLVILEKNDLDTLFQATKYTDTLYKIIHSLPKLNLTAELQPITQSTILCKLLIEYDFFFNEKLYKNSYYLLYHLIVFDHNYINIIYYQKVYVSKQQQSHHLHIYLPIYAPCSPNYFIQIFSDSLFTGFSSEKLVLNLTNMILPTQCQPQNELYDMSLTSIEQLNNKKYIQYFHNVHNITHLNSILTQCYPSIMTQHNLYLAYPIDLSTGDQLIVLSMIQQWNHTDHASSRIVYVCGTNEIAIKQYNKLHKNLINYFDVTTVLLDESEELIVHYQRLKSFNVVFTSAKQYYLLQNRYKNHSVLNTQVNLFIFDNIEFVADPQIGVYYETLISRTRFYTSNSSNTRLVGTSCCVLNGSDIGAWLNCTAKNSICSFGGNTREIPIEIQLNTIDKAVVDETYINLRVLRNIFGKLNKHSPDQQSIIVSDKSQFNTMQQLSKLYNIYNDNNDDNQLHWLNMNNHQQIELLSEKLNALQFDQLTITGLLCGISYIDYIKMTSDQIEFVYELYDQHVISVLVVDQNDIYNIRFKQYIFCVFLLYSSQLTIFQLYQICSFIGTNDTSNTKIKPVIQFYLPNNVREYYKKYMINSILCESQLMNQRIDFINILNSEIVCKRINSYESLINYLSWSYMYYRIQYNCNYYYLHSNTLIDISTYLSELAESLIESLARVNAVEVDEQQFNIQNN